MSSEPLTRRDADPTDPYDGGDGYAEPDDFSDADDFDDADFDDLGFDDGSDGPDGVRGPDGLETLAAGESEPVLLVWPRAEYEQVDQRWPEILEPIGADSWDDYRRQYQALIGRWAMRGLPPLLKVTGTADGFADWLVEQGADPLSVDLVAMAEAYGLHLAEQTDTVELPPAAADPCWCGSGVRYARCCRPLAPG